MTFKVYILGGTPAASDCPAPHNPAARLSGLRDSLAAAAGAAIAVEQVGVTGPLGDTLRELLAPESTLGAELPLTLAQEAAHSCTGLSSLALHSGLATAVLRRGQREPRLTARDLLARAIIASLGRSEVRRVRTALILGAGRAARSSLAALHELGCNRFLIGYGNPRSPDELSRQVSHWKKQVHYFPLGEMREFFAWAERQGIYESPFAGTAATDKEHRLRAEREDRQDPRRWELIINATPVGNPGVEPPNLLPDRRFLACSGRVMDLAGNGHPTPLLGLAREAGLPTIDAHDIGDNWVAESNQLWLSEFKRRIDGDPEEPEHYPRQEQRRFVLKRR